MISDSETIYTTPSYIFAIIAKDSEGIKIRRITADTIDDYVEDGSGSAHTTSYVTTDYLDEKGYATETQVETMVETQVAALKVTLETEMKEYVDEVVGEQVAELVPEEVEKYVETATPEDIRDLFSV